MKKNYQAPVDAEEQSTQLLSYKQISPGWLVCAPAPAFKDQLISKSSTINLIALKLFLTLGLGFLFCFVFAAMETPAGAPQCPIPLH